MRRLSESIKVDIAIPARPVSAEGTTSPYFKLDKYSRALFVWSVHDTANETITAGQTADGSLTTSTGTLYQAKDASAATSAVALTSGTAIVSLSAKTIKFEVAPGLALAQGATFAITGYDINGDAKTALTYTGTGSGTAAASTGRYFALGVATAGETANVSTCCTNIAAILNNTTYGVPGLYASANSSSVSCRALNPGEMMFSITASNTSTLTMAGSQWMGMLEVNASSLTLSSDFTHVALNVINESGYTTAAFIIRAGRRLIKPVQMVGKLTTLGE